MKVRKTVSVCRPCDTRHASTRKARRGFSPCGPPPPSIQLVLKIDYFFLLSFLWQFSCPLIQLHKQTTTLQRILLTFQLMSFQGPWHSKQITLQSCKRKCLMVYNENCKQNGACLSVPSSRVKLDSWKWILFSTRICTVRQIHLFTWLQNAESERRLRRRDFNAI